MMEIRALILGGRDTIDIAGLLGRTEAEVYNRLPGVAPEACRQPQDCQRRKRKSELCRRCHMLAMRSTTKARRGHRKGAEALAAFNAARVAWCPPDLLGDYRAVAGKVGAVEGRRIIEAHIARLNRAFVEAAE